MSDLLTTIAETIGGAVGGILGLSVETTGILGVLLVVMHVLTHEVPILVLGVLAAIRLLSSKNCKGECNEHRR
jgi:hypothetical protein